MHLTALLFVTVIYLATSSDGRTSGEIKRSSRSDLQPEGGTAVDIDEGSGRRQTVVVSRGLMGSGKSTAMRTAAMLLGGDWLNQDEFFLPGRHWKDERNSFFDSVSNSTRCGKSYVFVDRMHTKVDQRRDIQAQIETCNGQFPNIAYLQWMHPADQNCSDPVKGRHHREVCLRNLRNRAGRHRLMPANAPFERILDDAAKKAQELTKEELEEYGANLFDIDVTLDRYGVVNEILRVLGRDKDFTEEQIRDAVQKVADIEKDKPELVSAGRSKPRSFQLKLSNKSTKELRDAVRNETWEYMHEKGMLLNDKFHVPLLYNTEPKNPDNATAEFERQLYPLVHKKFSFEVSSVVCSGARACALPVDFHGHIPCRNEHPHITLGVGRDASPRESDDMLSAADHEKHPSSEIREWALQKRLNLSGIVLVINR
ncbi:hypothetical protein FOL46_002814 [Perkinsus olseni]|uniref:tRNA ligase phosphodiesterase domain-containing protein n=1 Tax=Perkinsus olseni TaxID=32597 RepID=A0A7J6M5R5_PEROL|nr:hypothetical protein FOL46_002814 [Perkinsus olseni]